VSVFIDTRTGRITCGNLGDSRAVMGVFNDNEREKIVTVELSTDHSADSKSEQARIRKDHPHDKNVLIDLAEGWEDEEPDWRVKRTCAFTRSIGDFQMKDMAAAALYNSYVPNLECRILPRPGTKASRTSNHVTKPYITNDPEIREFDLPRNEEESGMAGFDNSFILVACDGVWDEMSSDEAVRTCARLFAEHGDAPNIADLFIEYTLKKAVERIRDTIEEEEKLTLEELKKRPPGKTDMSCRSCLHDDITVIILRFGNGSPQQVYKSCSASLLGNFLDTKTEPKTTQELFNQVDVDGKGVLGIADLSELMKKLGRPLKGNELQKCFNDIDSDGKGCVSYDKFDIWWKKYQRRHPLESGKGQRRGMDSVGSQVSMNRNRKPVAMKMNDALDKLLYDIEKKKKEDTARLETDAQLMKMVEVFKGMTRWQLQILFDALDVNKKGHLVTDEIRGLVSKALGTDATELLIETAFAEMDADGSGEVDFDEFCDFFGVMD